MWKIVPKRKKMLSRLEELALVTRCVAADDRNAFGRLVEEYSPGLRRFLLNLTLGDASLTDDLSQETFLKAYTSIRSFQGLSRFKTWLYRIACNEFYTYMRKHKEGFGDAGETPSEELSFSHHATEARIDVQTCLKALTRTERTIVLLFYLEDQPIKKIAEITSLPQGTIKSYLSRARVKMAKVLQS